MQKEPTRHIRGVMSSFLPNARPMVIPDETNVARLLWQVMKCLSIIGLQEKTRKIEYVRASIIPIDKKQGLGFSRFALKYPIMIHL